MAKKLEKTSTNNRISIVIPAHNEEENIEATITEIADHFRNSQIIVVCNGCVDRTFEIARKIKRPNVDVLNYHERLGKGGAILEGFKHANGDIVGFVDADGSFRTEDVEKVIQNVKRYDAVIASKWRGKNFFEVQSGLSRKIGSRVWNLSAKLLGGVNFMDTQAGLKFFRRDVVEAILKEDFMCLGFDFDVELLHKIKNRGFRINEIYVPIRDGGKSTFNMKNSPKMFLNLLKFRLSKENV